MFLGTYKTYFTGKNRITLPKKFRKELGNQDIFYILMEGDGEIWGFNFEEWQKQAENRLRIPLNTEEGKKQRRKFFSRAQDAELDSQGRFVISQEFADFAKLGEEILMIGAGDHFEIWNPRNWEKEVKIR